MGRPKKDNPKTEFIGIRLLPEEKRAIEEYAHTMDMPVSRLILEIVMTQMKMNIDGR